MNMAKHPELRYQIRAGATMAPVRQFLVDIGQPLPHPVLSCAWTAEEEDGTIVAMSQLQSIPVIEPFHMYRSNGYDGSEVLGKLFEMTKEFVIASGMPRVLMHPGHRAMDLMVRRELRGHVIEIPDRFLDWRKAA